LHIGGTSFQTCSTEEALGLVGLLGGVVEQACQPVREEGAKQLCDEWSGGLDLAIKGGQLEKTVRLGLTDLEVCHHGCSLMLGKFVQGMTGAWAGGLEWGAAGDDSPAACC
jgi:hypothetical protein